MLICLLHGATFLCLKTTGDMHERSRQLARRVAPFTAAAVIGFIIWTHVTASNTFFLNVIELLAVLAVIAAVWLVYEHRDGFAFAATTVTIAACIVAIFVDLYPNVMVSSHQRRLQPHRAQHGVRGVLAQGDDRRRRSSSCRWCSSTRPGPTTCSAGGSAGPNSSPPRHRARRRTAAARPRHLKRLPRLLVDGP